VSTEQASAKINLFLHIGDRRADGFHPLQSLAVFTALGDVLTMDAAKDLSLSVDGPFAKGLEGEGDNLVLRAARALGQQGARVRLTKNLPVASGIGGGSADAAAALRGLNRLWGLGKDDTALAGIAAALGSDIPACVLSTACFMEGRGEVLRRAEAMPYMPLLLVNPGVAVPTKDVFAALDTRSGAEMALPRGRFADTADLLRFLETTRNDLEAPARHQRSAGGADRVAGRPSGAHVRQRRHLFRHLRRRRLLPARGREPETVPSGLVDRADFRAGGGHRA
jgi:4-diphosphocytidyl-2-C-methyl-D-erythritol kinase